MASDMVIQLLRQRFANLRGVSDSLKGVVEHKGLRGRFREIFVETMLAPYLPPTVELLTGTIVLMDGKARELRSEDDVIVFDRTWAPPILHGRGREAVVPVSGVRAHIEVKSTLTLDDLRAAVGAAAEIDAGAFRKAPVGLVFAYSTDIGRDHHMPDLLMQFSHAGGYVASPGKSACPIQGVCVLGTGCWLLLEAKEGGLARPGWYFVEHGHDHELLAFISVISNTMYGNGGGIGTHALDPAWLIGPNPEMKPVIPLPEDRSAT